MAGNTALADPPASVRDRARRLRETLTGTSAGGELIAELVPADIARVGKGTVLDFCSWVQWDQWGQWQ